MKLKWSDLWTWKGVIGNREYLFWGFLLFALKYGMDRVVAHLFFHRPWWIWSYLAPAASGSLDMVAPSDRAFYITLSALALPFIWTGVVITLRRLRDLRMSPGLVLLFFVPIANLFFFMVLGILPSSSGKVRVLTDVPGRKRLERLIPESVWGSALMAIAVNLVSGLIFTRLSVHTLQQYGWGLFVGLPFCLGLTSSLIYSYHKPRSLSACITVALLSLGFVFLGLLVFAFEGVVCLFMAAPIAGVIAVFGALLGYGIRDAATDYDTSKIFPAILLLMPAVLGVEKAAPATAQTFAVRTTIEVDAPPQEVWKNVVAFAQIPEPEEWYFRAGIAYPIRAWIHGSGTGAVRHCVFSTGEFVEPIVIWDEPELLRFSVTANPAPMEEYTFYAHIHPPHLAHFLESQGGQFLLTPLPGNRTRLEGTTWYQHHMWPAFYWEWWSDFLIHRIHLRVLNHVRTQTLAEM